MGFVLSQIFGILALVFVCISYYFNSKKLFLFYQIISNIFYSASFLCLGVFVGGINTIISTIRVITLYFIERKGHKPLIWLLFIFAGLYVGSGIILYKNSLDIMAIVCYEIFNIAMFCHNIKLVRLLMIPPNIMIALYNFLNQTYTNAILDCVEICVLVVAVIRFNFSFEKKKMKYLI